MKIGGNVRALKRALPPGSDPFVYAAQTGMIADYVTDGGELLGLRILDRDGKGATAVPAQLDPAVAKDLDLARQVALKGQAFTGAFVTVANEPAVVLAVPVVDEGVNIGVVEAIVSLRRISDRIRDEGKGDVTAFVVDRNGKVLLHSEPAVEVQHPDFSNLKIVQEFKKAPVHLTIPYDDTRGGERMTMLGTVAPVAGRDWGVVVQKPEKLAYASVSKMVRATITWISIALAVAILDAIVFASGIAGPVRALAERTREIANGNYPQRAQLKTHNEIGELAEASNASAGAIE